MWYYVKDAGAGWLMAGRTLIKCFVKVERSTSNNLTNMRMIKLINTRKVQREGNILALN